MLIPLSVNLGFDDPAFYQTAPARIRALIESNLQTESDYMPARKGQRFGGAIAAILLRAAPSALSPGCGWLNWTDCRGGRSTWAVATFMSAQKQPRARGDDS